ncbi:MAG: hypothetical protein JST04_05715 [Bdellovibrionales bacterium]|nr:hypothetical protein [Bdellovibrionales bacterium]
MDLRNEQGISLVFVIIVGGLIAGMAFYLSSRHLMLKKQVVNYNMKGQILDDRKVILFDLANRPLPSPTP